MHIYTTGIIHHCNHSITNTNEIGYVHDYPLAPLICPFPLTWNPPCCDRIRPPLSRVALKLYRLISLTCPCGPSPETPTPWGFSRPKYTFIRTTLRTQPICSLTDSTIYVMYICVWLLYTRCSIDVLFTCVIVFSHPVVKGGCTCETRIVGTNSQILGGPRQTMKTHVEEGRQVNQSSSRTRPWWKYSRGAPRR